jgi:hypothetical protein
VKPPADTTNCLGCNQPFPPSAYLKSGIRARRCLQCGTSYRKEYMAHRPNLVALQRLANQARRRRDWQLTLLRDSRSSAQRRGLTHDLTIDVIEELWVKQAGRCYWFGVGLQLGQVPRHPLMPSLDRLDNNRGYSKKNVVLASFAANMGRSSMPAADFKLVVATIAAAFRGAPDQASFIHGA